MLMNVMLKNIIFEREQTAIEVKFGFSLTFDLSHLNLIYRVGIKSDALLN